jgi:glycosyltransferase involved in cell wall biosynthesis
LTLQRAIESVQQQTYGSVEHVVLDGSSTDGTMDVIRPYSNRLDYFASDPDEGIYDALNKAIPLARGDLICVLNSDDWLEPDAAEKAVGRLKDIRSPTILLTAANARHGHLGDGEPPVALQWYPAPVHAGSYFTCADDCHNGMYATRGAYERSGPYDTRYHIAADFKWLMSCFDSGIEFVYTRDITVNYVLGGASGDAEMHGRECVRAIRERFPSLTPEEAGGLYHSFFVFPTFDSIPGRPDDPSEFLRRVLTRHSDDSDLVTALAWALLADADHRRGDDGRHIAEPSPAPRSSVKDRVKVALQDHPRAYRLVRRVYAGVRRA